MCYHCQIWSYIVTIDLSLWLLSLTSMLHTHTVTISLYNHIIIVIITSLSSSSALLLYFDHHYVSIIMSSLLHEHYGSCFWYYEYMMKPLLSLYIMLWYHIPLIWSHYIRNWYHTLSSYLLLVWYPLPTHRCIARIQHIFCGLPFVSRAATS